MSKGNLIFLGIGKSGKVSEKISATLSSLGRPSFYINAAEASHGDLGATKRKDIVVILSFSGETEELIDFIEGEKNQIEFCFIKDLLIEIITCTEVLTYKISFPCNY